MPHLLIFSLSILCEYAHYQYLDQFIMDFLATLTTDNFWETIQTTSSNESCKGYKQNFWELVKVFEIRYFIWKIDWVSLLLTVSPKRALLWMLQVWTGLWSWLPDVTSKEGVLKWTCLNRSQVLAPDVTNIGAGGDFGGSLYGEVQDIMGNGYM